jgi:pilus assembly protein CpaE
MSEKKLRVAVMAPEPYVRDLLALHVEVSERGSVRASLDEYCAAEDDGPTQRILEAAPEVVLVDMADARAGIKCLYVLHSVMPDSWLYACGPTEDPQLIIESMQAGAREFLPQPVTARSVALGLARYLDVKDRTRSDHRKRGRIYTVTSGKGGAGATSVAINLASTISTSSDLRAAVVDMNSPVGDVAAYLRAEPESCITDALAAAAKLDRLLLESFMCHAGNISLLAGSNGYAPPATQPTPASLARLLRILSSAYTHTFVDMPSSLDPELVKPALEASEAVIVVITPELPAIWRTHRLINFLQDAGAADKIRLILNRDDSREDINSKEISRALNQPVYWRLPNSYDAAIDAINQGKPLVEVNHSGLAASYRELATDLTGVAFAQQKNTFTRLFSRAS